MPRSDVPPAAAADLARPTIPAVITQHANGCAALRHLRSVLVRAPHIKLHHLRRLDDRIAAHLDGLTVAGLDGWKLAIAALESPGVGETFTCSVLAIQDGNAAALDKLLAVAEVHSPAVAGLVSASGWVAARALRGIASTLLASANAFHRQVGLAACSMHRVDPGAALDAALIDANAPLRARALRLAGELGRIDRLPACLATRANEDAECRYQAARSAALMGDHHASIAMLQTLASSSERPRRDVLRQLLMLTTPAQSQSLLETLARNPIHVRDSIKAVGLAGDTCHVPRLIEQMSVPELARLAGESFSLITGVDLAELDLESKLPEGVEPGPSADPADDNVAMDEDESLPWPEPVKIAAWWQANRARFTAGTRYFMGERPTAAHCVRVLKDGFQRQRIAAAHHLCLLIPGTSLFNTAAPAWRQQRLLAQMTA